VDLQVQEELQVQVEHLEVLAQVEHLEVLAQVEHLEQVVLMDIRDVHMTISIILEEHYLRLILMYQHH
jgi:hypothetical protein